MASKSPQALAKRAAYQREYRRKEREANPNYDHKAHYEKYGRRLYVRKKYGLTPPQLATIKIASGKACHICGESEKELVLDHSHDNGQVRGMLCKHCNFLLGHARDRIDILQSAIRYLENRKSGPLFLDYQHGAALLKELGYE
jgi:hypothetical protein